MELSQELYESLISDYLEVIGVISEYADDLSLREQEDCSECRYTWLGEIKSIDRDLINLLASCNLGTFAKNIKHTTGLLSTFVKRLTASRYWLADDTDWPDSMREQRQLLATFADVLRDMSCLNIETHRVQDE